MYVAIAYTDDKKEIVALTFSDTEAKDVVLGRCIASIPIRVHASVMNNSDEVQFHMGEDYRVACMDIPTLNEASMDTPAITTNTTGEKPIESNLSEEGLLKHYVHTLCLSIIEDLNKVNDAMKNDGKPDKALIEKLANSGWLKDPHWISVKGKKELPRE